MHSGAIRFLDPLTNECDVCHLWVKAALARGREIPVATSSPRGRTRCTVEEEAL